MGLEQRDEITAFNRVQRISVGFPGTLFTTCDLDFIGA